MASLFLIVLANDGKRGRLLLVIGIIISWIASFLTYYARDIRFALNSTGYFYTEWTDAWFVEINHPMLPRIAPYLLIIWTASWVQSGPDTLVTHAKLWKWSAIMIPLVACALILPLHMHLSTSRLNPADSLRLWFAIYSSSYRVIYAAIFAWMYIVWNCRKTMKHGKNEHEPGKPLTPAAYVWLIVLAASRRLSFPFLMSTFLPGTFLLAIFRQPFFISGTYYFLLSVPTFFISLALALFLHLFFEAPFEQMVKRLRGSLTKVPTFSTKID